MPCIPPSPPRCTRSDSMNMQSQVQERDTFGDLEEMMLHGDHSVSIRVFVVQVP